MQIHLRWSDERQEICFAIAAQIVVEIDVRAIEVANLRTLLAHHEVDIADARRDAVLHGVVYHRAVTQRQHAFFDRLGDGQAPCPPACYGDDCFGAVHTRCLLV